jgi:flagellar protein FlgJ
MINLNDGGVTGTAAADTVYRSKASAAAAQFEAYFIAHMLRDMRAGARTLARDDGLFQDRASQDLLELADGMVADQLAGRRAFGIADAILRQLLPPAEAVQPALNEPSPAVALNR